MKRWIIFGVVLGMVAGAWAQVRITEICPRPETLDPNGRESGWIELTNTSDAAVNLKDFQLIRFNRGKEDKSKNRKALANYILEPQARVLIYTSEAYDNADSETVAMYPAGETGAEMMVFPFKVSPKKYPTLRLYTDGGKTLIETFSVPVDLPDGQSFGPGASEVAEELVGASSLYSYRAVGADAWQTGGRGRLAGVINSCPENVPDRLTAEIAADNETFVYGVLTDQAGFTRKDAWDLSSNTEKNQGLTLSGEAVAQLTGAYTLAFWFKSAEPSSSVPLFDSRPSSGANASGILLALTAEGQLLLQPRNAAKQNQELQTDTEANYADGAWHSVVLVAGQQVGDALRLWVDGEKTVDAALSVEAALHSALPLCFGRAYDSSYWGVFSGALADIRLYPRALTEAEALAVPQEAPEARELTPETWTATGVTAGEDGCYTFAGAAQSTGAYLEGTVAAEKAAGGETVDFWVQPASLTLSTAGHSIALIDARAKSAAGYMFIVNEDGSLKLQRGVGGQSSYEETAFSSKLQVGKWTHLTLQLEAASRTVTLFVDGVFAETAALAKPYSAATASRRFGGSRDSWWSTFRGKLTAPRLFSGLLSTKEIAKLHNASPLAETVVLESGTVAGAQTVVPFSDGALGAIEAQCQVVFPEARVGDRWQVTVTQPKGSVAVTLDGKPVAAGVDLEPPAAGEHTLGWVLTPGAEGAEASVSAVFVRPVSAVTRAIMPQMTPGKANDLTGAVPYGPNIGPAVGKKASGSGVTAASPAPVGVDYSVTYEIYPLSEDAENAIQAVTLLYRADFEEVQRVPMTLVGANRWRGVIPAVALPAAGHLIRYAAEITDAAGNEWRSPSFKNPDDGIEWFGTIVAPEAGQLTESLQTFHLFADQTALQLMDKQYDAVAGAAPFGARVGVFDGQTNTYYDNVRIDLRGNTSAGFYKKSHGLRFNKCQPLVCSNPFSGEEIETRKTSFVAEYCDPTYIRQALSFWVWRQAGNLVPFDYPVRLQMNGAFYQLAFHSNRFTDELIEDYYGLDPLGYAYKNVGTFDPRGVTTAGGIEKKTPDDGNEKDLSVLLAFCQGLSSASKPSGNEDAALTQKVVREFNLPAWLNYLAAARITQESDDVWANICAYGDVNGTGTWMPLAYDHNLSFGQWYYNDNPIGKIGLRPADDGYKSHPFYGGFWVKASGFKGNYAIEAVLQSPKFRRLYLRRLRTLMDQLLKAPGTTQEETPLWTYAQQLRTALEPLVEADRTKWQYDTKAITTKIWVWDHALTLDEGFTDLWENYVVPRREHLFVTHSVNTTTKTVGYGIDYAAGIPEAQPATAELAAAISFGNAVSTDGTTRGFSDAERLVIHNANTLAVDMSGWTLSGAVSWTLPAGTVVDAEDDLVVVFDRKAYVAAHADTLADAVIVGNAAAQTSATFLTLADAEGVIAASVDWTPPTNERLYLRVAEVLANTAAEDGDEGEYLVLTNCSDTVSLDLTGVRIRAKKSGNEWAQASLDVTLPGGLTLAPLAALKLEKAAYFPGMKLTNNKVDMDVLDVNGAVCQTLQFASKTWPSTYGCGASLIATAFGSSVGSADWRPSFVLNEAQPAAQEAVKQAVRARPAVAGWLAALDAEGKAALLAFNGSADTLETCWLVDIPPQSEPPQVALTLTEWKPGEAGAWQVRGGLQVNGAEKNGRPNGEVSIWRYVELDAEPEVEKLGQASFPMVLPGLTEPYHFFKLRLE